jgi:hypothetical protein
MPARIKGIPPMFRTPIVVVVAALAVLQGGCGSVCNLASKDPRVFGGPLIDAQVLTTPPPDGASPPSGNGAAYLVAIIAADMAISCAVDAMTIPLALLLQRESGNESCSRADNQIALAPSPALPSEPAPPASAARSPDDWSLADVLMDEHTRDRLIRAKHPRPASIARSLSDSLAPLGQSALGWAIWEAARQDAMSDAAATGDGWMEFMAPALRHLPADFSRADLYSDHD